MTQVSVTCVVGGAPSGYLDVGRGERLCPLHMSTKRHVKNMAPRTVIVVRI